MSTMYSRFKIRSNPVGEPREGGPPPGTRKSHRSDLVTLMIHGRGPSSTIVMPGFGFAFQPAGGSEFTHQPTSPTQLAPAYPTVESSGFYFSGNSFELPVR
jgi:hypothetical protein